MARKSLLPSLWGQDDRDFGFESLHRDLDRVFDDFKSLFPVSGSKKTADVSGFLTPKIDVSETDKTFDVVVEIPGVTKEDLDVSVANETLIIKGEKKTEHEEMEKNYHLIERSSGSFYRSIPLGFDVDTKKVETNFKDGVLTLKIEKPAELSQKVKKIEVKSAA